MIDYTPVVCSEQELVWPFVAYTHLLNMCDSSLLFHPKDILSNVCWCAVAVCRVCWSHNWLQGITKDVYVRMQRLFPYVILDVRAIHTIHNSRVVSKTKHLNGNVFIIDTKHKKWIVIAYLLSKDIGLQIANMNYLLFALPIDSSEMKYTHKAI